MVGVALAVERRGHQNPVVEDRPRRARRLAILSAPRTCWPARVASASPIGGLVKPLTPKQRLKRVKRLMQAAKKKGQ